MNDKIKQLLATAYKVDAIGKIKWRIENRELLRKQRKIELKILIEKNKLNYYETNKILHTRPNQINGNR